MALVYGICLVSGGIFVLLSAVSGLDGVDFASDVDVAADGDWAPDANLESDITPDRPRNGKRQNRRLRRCRFPWLPIWSFRFWTFASCIFGLTGLLLRVLRVELPVVGEVAIALGAAVVCGTIATWILAWLGGQGSTDSLIRADDWLGAVGVVDLPFDCHSGGKVKLALKGSEFYVRAMTTENRSFARGDRVFVVGVEGSSAWIVSEESAKIS